MTTSPATQDPQHLYRIDKFRVPPAARSGTFNFVTVVEWDSTEAVEGAKKSVAAKFEGNGFNPREVRARLGIEADVAIYLAIPQAASSEALRN